MEPADARKPDDLSDLRRLDRPSLRRIAVEPEVCPVLVVIRDVLAKQSQQCRSFSTTTWSSNSRRSVPMNRSTNGFCHGDLGDEKRCSTPKSIDLGIDLLASAGEPPPIRGMLMCIRGECDVFNGEKSAVARTEAGIAIVRRHPDACGVARGFLYVERRQREARRR